MGKKKAMDSHNPKGYQNERNLFHGCPEDVTEKTELKRLVTEGLIEVLQERMVCTYVRICTHICEWILEKHAYFTHPILLIS